MLKGEEWRKPTVLWSPFVLFFDPKYTYLETKLIVFKVG